MLQIYNKKSPEERSEDHNKTFASQQTSFSELLELRPEERFLL